MPAFPISVCSERGRREVMENEFACGVDFCAVFDGHGGSKVSNYLQEHLYAQVQAALPRILDARNNNNNNKATKEAIPSVDSNTESRSETAATTTTANVDETKATVGIGRRLSFRGIINPMIQLNGSAFKPAAGKSIGKVLWMTMASLYPEPAYIWLASCAFLGRLVMGPKGRY
jgi:hypothetical protein